MRELRDLLSGPPPTLPAALDVAAERWAATPPRLRWLLVGVVTVGALALVGRGAVASPWGAPTAVVVTARDLPAGHELTATDLTTATWPATLSAGVADRAVAVGAVTTAPIPAGTPVRLAWLADGGIAGLLDPGRAAVVVVDPAAPLVRVGWPVDVVGRRFDGTASVLADAARVLAVDGGTVWLDVARDQAAAVSGASARGEVSLVLLPPASRAAAGSSGVHG